MALHPKMAVRVMMIVYCAALIYGAALVAVGAYDYLPNEYGKYSSFPFPSSSVPQSCVLRWRVFVQLLQRAM